MRRVLAFLLVLGVAAGLAAAAVVSASTAGSRASKPALRLTKAAPITLRGTSFRSGERVRVSATSRTTAVKRAAAGANGSFVVRFAIPYDRCEGLLVVARGALGSRAVYKRPMLECPPRL
jgi:hypothetical protein